MRYKEGRGGSQNTLVRNLGSKHEGPTLLASAKKSLLAHIKAQLYLLRDLTKTVSSPDKQGLSLRACTVY